MRTLYVVNESTVVSRAQAQTLAAALNIQTTLHMPSVGWRGDVGVKFLPGGAQAKIPAGGAVLHLLDTSDQPGALGYHDEDGKDVAFARVFCKTSGAGWPETASHEACELIVDEHVNLTALDDAHQRLYALEVGDPVQGTGYSISGVGVANFATPAYFDPKGVGPYDYRRVLKAPFTLAPQGYMSYLDLSQPQSGWQQEWGQERTTPPSPDGDDRLLKR